jgi:hypothetical protein
LKLLLLLVRAVIATSHTLRADFHLRRSTGFQYRRLGHILAPGIKHKLGDKTKAGKNSDNNRRWSVAQVCLW